MPDPLRQPIITSKLKDPFSELERLKFLEMLDNALMYAVAMGQMTQVESDAIGQDYHTYLFEGEGQYIDPTTLPAYQTVRMFTPQRIKGREQVIERDKAAAKLKAFAEEQATIRQAQAKTREIERARAGFATQRAGMRGEMERRVPTMPSPTEEYFPFLEKLPTNVKRYFESRLGDVWGKFKEEMPEARQKWWGFLHGRRPQVESAEGMGFPSAGGSRQELYKWSRRHELEGQDPWKQYVGGYPFLSEFAELSPRERGYYPAKYRPPTRWLT